MESSHDKPSHIVKGNIFDALHFSAPETSRLKTKAERKRYRNTGGHIRLLTNPTGRPF